MSWRQLPNVVTAARIALVPPLLWLMREGDYRAAFWVALGAGVSDAFDGWLAKRFDWQTRLGGLLDPIADKLLIAASFVALWSAGALPGWLLALVLGRDLVIVGGALAYQRWIGPVAAAPSRLSKATTALQIALALGLLTQLAWFGSHALPKLVHATALFLVAAVTLASGVDYVRVWSRRALDARAARRR